VLWVLGFYAVLQGLMAEGTLGGPWGSVGQSAGLQVEKITEGTKSTHLESFLPAQKILLNGFYLHQKAISYGRFS
jgi:hypothetical protein